MDLRANKAHLGIKDIFLNDCASFPNIKIELNNQLHNLKLDLTIFQKRNNGQKYVDFIKNAIKKFSVIRPLFFSVHKILQSFGLHNPAKNGLKTYALFLMIFYYVRAI